MANPNFAAQGIGHIGSSKAFWMVLCVIMILGATVRIYGLTRQPLWLDEANGVRIAEKGFGEIISELKGDVSPPLYYFVIHIWIKIFGSGELSTRVFVCIFGILLIPAVYYVGSSLFNRRMGMISAFIAAIAQFHIRYSQEVRMYSMLALLGLLSIYFLYKAITDNSRKYWIGYIIFTILTIYTHNYGIFIAASGVVFFAIYAVTHGARLKIFLIAQGCMAILYIPWLPILLMKHFGSGAIVGWIPNMRAYHLYETFTTYSGLVFQVFGSVANSLIMWLGFALFMCCFLAGIFSIKKYKAAFVPYIRSNMELVLLLCYLFVTLGIPMLISVKKPIYLTGRYSIAAWPAFPLILGVGVSKIKSRYSLVIVLFSILFISSISVYWHHSVWIKSHDDRAIATFIESKAKEDDLIVFAPSWIDIPINYYLRKPLKHLGYPGRSLKEPPEDNQVEKSEPRKPEEILGLVESKLKGTLGKIFFIHHTGATWVDDIDIVKKSLDESFTKIEGKKYGDVEITIYEN